MKEIIGLSFVLVLFVTIHVADCFPKEEDIHSNPSLSVIFATGAATINPFELLKLSREFETHEDAKKASQETLKEVEVLIKLDKRRGCEHDLMSTFANLLREYSYHGCNNVVEYLKHQRYRFIYYCRDTINANYVEQYYATKPELRAEIGALFNRIKQEAVSFYSTKPFYRSAALIKGLAKHIANKPDKISKKINKRKEVTRKQFETVYEEHVRGPCRALFVDEDSKSYVDRSEMLINELAEDKRVMDILPHSTRDLMIQAYTCYAVNLRKELLSKKVFEHIKADLQ